MKRRGWSARVLARYTLLHVPSTALLVVVLILVQRWLNLSAWFVYGLVGLSVLKDIAMFPLVWRSYDTDHPPLTNTMEGARGMAVDHLNPEGYVEIRAELWKAEVLDNGPSIKRGEPVRVCGTRGLTLLVKPDKEP